MGRRVRVVDRPVVEAVHELALSAIQGEEARRVLASEGLDLPGELVGRDFAVSGPIPVADVLPVAVEPPSGMLATAPGRSGDPRWVQLPVADGRTAHRAREVADDASVSHRTSIDTVNRR